MSLFRLLPLVACAVSMLNLSSCAGGGADVVNPTVAEMDALDVQWGLSPRKPKGGPRRSYQYMDSGSDGGSGGGAAGPAAAAPAARETVRGLPPAASAPAAGAPAAPVSVPAPLR